MSKSVSSSHARGSSSHARVSSSHARVSALYLSCLSTPTPRINSDVLTARVIAGMTSVTTWGHRTATDSMTLSTLDGHVFMWPKNSSRASLTLSLEHMGVTLVIDVLATSWLHTSWIATLVTVYQCLIITEVRFLLISHDWIDNLYTRNDLSNNSTKSDHVIHYACKIQTP